MRIIFIVQGEGRGHLTQAIAMEELLTRNGHQVVEVLVGKSNSRRLPGFFNRSIHAPVKRFLSPNFLPSAQNKRADIPRSVAYNLRRLPTYVRSMRYLCSRIKESRADLVINFYELLTGFAYLLFRPRVPQVSIGHQYLFLHSGFQFPGGHPMSWMALRFFTRLTCMGATCKLALSFHAMSDDTRQRIRVVPPLLRKEVLSSEGRAGDYLHGYLLNAGFGDNVRAWHAAHKDVPLHFFWDKPGEDDVTEVDSTLSFHQIDDREFLRFMVGCKAYATTAGFESVCEAMYLGKPMLMVPAHIEQTCNAYDAALNGAGIISEDFDLDKLLSFVHGYTPNKDFRPWARSGGWRILQGVEEAVWGPERVAPMFRPGYCNTVEMTL